MMRIGVLTSSRADYGIYRPLLKALKNDPFFDCSIIAFGTHLSTHFGKTIDRIRDDGFEVKYTVSSMLLGDDANTIASATALTSMKFAEFWKEHAADFDLVFCLGDRYEMFAAVIAGVPFGIRFAHLHGGETTLGAIDNVYRHSITHASLLHFTSAEVHASRVKSLLGHDEGVFVCG
jgi:GDP/UDP-N,N'-diacetylbacillosamine 2-epimerase (hydrolysing)